VHSPVDISDRSAEKQSAATKTIPVDSPTAPPPSISSASPMAPHRAAVKEEVLRLAEEQLDIGKRQVETGRARVRRFVVEQPVESKVTLREEHTQMLRRPVSDPSAAKDVDWSEKIIEIIETAEQPVVTKTTRIAEEVVIRREGSDRVEIVRETIRRQQVELERLPGDVKKAA
jgi:uncharacterized protein (TIGR02271 family)